MKDDEVVCYSILLLNLRYLGYMEEGGKLQHVFTPRFLWRNDWMFMSTIS